MKWCAFFRYPEHSSASQFRMSRNNLLHLIHLGVDNCQNSHRKKEVNIKKKISNHKRTLVVTSNPPPKEIFCLILYGFLKNTNLIYYLVTLLSYLDVNL